MLCCRQEIHIFSGGELAVILEPESAQKGMRLSVVQLGFRTGRSKEFFPPVFQKAIPGYFCPGDDVKGGTREAGATTCRQTIHMELWSEPSKARFDGKKEYCLLLDGKDPSGALDLLPQRHSAPLAPRSFLARRRPYACCFKDPRETVFEVFGLRRALRIDKVSEERKQG